MIRVNLLPEEFRPKEGASWAVLLTAMAVAAVVVLLLVGVAVVKINAGSLEATLKEKTAEAAKKKTEANKYDSLEKAIRDASLRETTIKEIAQSKLNWAKQLNHLINLILDGQMWIHELELSERGKPRLGEKEMETTPALRIDCYFVGKQSRLIDEFYEGATNSRAFFRIFDPKWTARPQFERKNISDVYGTKFIPDDELNLFSSLEFSLRPYSVVKATEGAVAAAKPTP